MKRGDTVLLLRPKRRLRAKLVELYDHYPAARIVLRGREMVVAAGEIVSFESVLEQRRAAIVQRNQAYIAKYPGLLASVKPGDTWRTWHDREGPNGPAWGIFSKLRRLGVEQVPIL